MPDVSKSGLLMSLPEAVARTCASKLCATGPGRRLQGIPC